MKYYLVLVPFLLVMLVIQSVSAVPGDIVWQQTRGGPAGEEWGYSLDSYPDGGVVVTGIAYSTDANVTGSRGNGDLWVVRLDSSGNQIWNRAYGGNESEYGLSVKSCLDGGSVIVGTTGSHSGDINGYHGNGDLWFLRLSASGDLLMQKVYAGNQTDEGGDILQTTDGGYVITGYTMSDDGDASGHHGGGDLWMIRLDQNGTMLWQKAMGGSKRDSGSSIIQTSDGGFAMTGNSYSSDGDVTANHGSSDLWVLKTDAGGNLLWQKTFGGSKLDWGHSLVELPGGDLVVTGVTASSDGEVSMNHGAGDIWVIRLTSAGEKVWEKTYGGSFSDNVWKMVPSSNDGVYLSGESFSVDGDFSGNHGDADLWVAEIDGNGTLLWYRMLGGQYYESGSWLTRMPDGNVTVCGTTRSSDGDVLGSRGEGDLWIVKVDTSGVVLPAKSLQSSTFLTPVTAAPIQKDEVNITNITPVDTGFNANTSSLSGTTGSEQNATPGGVTTPVLLPLPGQNLTPTDPDSDGKYEDMNGNGKIDMQDSSLFFSSYDWITVNYPPAVSDFNGNGVVDFGDIQSLFEEVST